MSKRDELIPAKNKKNYKATISRVKNILDNFVEFVEGVMLTVVSLFAMHHAYYTYSLNHWTEYILFGSGAGMTILGFTLLGKHFVKGAK